MISSQIQKNFDKLTSAERKAASLVLASPELIPGMTVQDFAKSCGVSPSAAVRFCKAVGIGGFAELKIAVARELGAKKEDDRLPAFDGSEGSERVVQKVFSSGMRTLRETLDMTDPREIEEIASVFSGAKRVFVFGIGTSAVVAADAQYRLAQLGIWATACTDILIMNVTAANLGPGDVVLAISHSGRTKAVVDAVSEAKNAGATAVAITSFSDSILSELCDYTLTVASDEENYPVEAVSARVAHICIIDALTMVIATKDFDNFAKHIKARNKILENIRY